MYLVELKINILNIIRAICSPKVLIFKAVFQIFEYVFIQFYAVFFGLF